jgi:hypothetical protein
MRKKEIILMKEKDSYNYINAIYGIIGIMPIIVFMVLITKLLYKKVDDPEIPGDTGRIN